MTKSMFQCTLYMQSDQNINHEYFTETFHVIFFSVSENDRIEMEK